MRFIKKDISLEEFKSRVPGFIPSFHKFDKTVNVTEDMITSDTVKFDEWTLKAVHEDANYGMFPSDVKWHKDGKEYTYPKLRSIKNFFDRYYGILNERRCGNKRLYKNAAEMYSNEGKDCGYTENECEEMDETAKGYGADLSNGTCELYDDILDDMLRVIAIPSEYADEWNTDNIKYADLHSWIEWFETTKDAIEKDSADCCLIEKYGRLGGDDMLGYLNSVDMDGELRHFTALGKASIDIPLTISQKIDAMGDFTPLCEEYEAGVDYSTAYDGFGSVVVSDGNTYIKKGGVGKGYKRNDKLKRDEWNDGDWEPYDEKGNPMFNRYAYKGMVMLAEPIEGYEVPDEYLLKPQNMADRYELRTGRFFQIIGAIYESFTCDYIKYQSRTNKRLNGAYFEVKYDGNVPYVMIGGKKHRALFDGSRYVFNFGYEKCGKTLPNIDCPIMKEGTFVSVVDKMYKVDEGKVTVDGTEYTMFDAYAETDDYGTVLFNEGDAVRASVSYDDGVGAQSWEPFIKLSDRIDDEETVDEHTSGYKADYDNRELVIFKPYTVYNANHIYGTCDSKLQHLKDVKLSYDDYGNELPGAFHVSGKSPVPTEGDVLDIPYHVGNVANCEYVGMTNTVDETIKLFNGDIITQIAFYMKDIKGDVVDGTVVKVNKDNYVDGKHRDNRPFIEECENKKKSIIENDGNTVIFDSRMYCDISYYLSNQLSVTTSGGEIGFYEAISSSYGSILYTDTFTLEKDEAVYGFAGGDDYKVSYYRMEPETKRVVLDDFRDDVVEIPQAKFDMEKRSEDGGYSYDKSVDWVLIWFSWEGTFDLDISVTTSKLPEEFDKKDNGKNGVGYGGDNRNRYRYNGRATAIEQWKPTDTNGRYHPHLLWCKDKVDWEGVEGVAVSMDRYFNGFNPTDGSNGYEGMGGDEMELIVNTHWFYNDGEPDYDLPTITKKFDMIIKVYHGGSIKYDDTIETWVSDGGELLDTLVFKDIYEPHNERNMGGDWCKKENAITKITYDKKLGTLSVDTSKFDGYGETVVIERETCTSPVFMEDTKFGLVLRQNIDGNIYVDRGVNQSHDKHLRLMEVRSVEAFEQYGNGFWNIIGN